MTHTNYRATPAKYGLEAFDLLTREALRMRIARGRAVWSDAEPVSVHPSSLPAYETRMDASIQYDGDGRIPDDLLGAPR